MPIYLYWGEDDFSLQQAVKKLRDRILDPSWASFNYDKISPDDPDAVIQALTQAMTPPFGSGGRLVWLVDTTLTQHCPEPLLAELERTLGVIPDATVLLLTCRHKPDGRLKSTKLLQNHTEQYKEFAPIPPWKTEQLVQQVREAAEDVGVKLDHSGIEFLAHSLGNDTRQLFNELQKLQLFYSAHQKPLTAADVANLVTANTQNSLQLASLILQGDIAKTLEVVGDLINRNEPALRIVATLVGQFRTWLWVKLMVESGERDENKIAKAAEIPNPKRIYFLRKEVQHISLSRLQQSLPLLLELEVSLKSGAPELSTLQTKMIELCLLGR